MVSEIGTVGLYYDADGYVEPAKVTRAQKPTGAAIGLMGRHVAGKGFLDAFFRFGGWKRLVAVVSNEASSRSIRAYAQGQPDHLMASRSLDVVEVASFRERFAAGPPTTILHFPVPHVPTFAWARQRLGPTTFSMTGVTHTLASLNGINSLNSLVTGPFEPHDALICTSEAVTQMVRRTTGIYSEYLRDRFGGEPRLVPRLATIPLGVDAEAYRPARPEERALIRQTLGIADDEVVFLFVGRLSFHAKANPFPMYHALARAARETGGKVHLLLSGWAANEHIHKAFHDGARVFAPNLRVTIVDGTKPEYRHAVWHAADAFTSLTDNIQETFGLSITEAMASGLPVVASDWDGYRDQVVDGETGLLVPSSMLADSMPDATTRLILGELSYDHFLAECSQAVAIDIDAATAAFSRLIVDEDYRRQLGRAGRIRATARFTWAAVVGAYEGLWRELDAERRAAAAGRATAPPDRDTTPACYPPVETVFEGYPTAIFDDQKELVADEHAVERLDWLIKLPLTNYGAPGRCTDAGPIRAALKAAREPATIGAIGEELGRAGVVPEKRRATIAWMIKYAILNPPRVQSPPEADSLPAAGPLAVER